MKFLAILSLFLSLCLSTSLSHADANPNPRDTLAEMLKFYGDDAASTQAASYAATETEVENMIRSYRLAPVPGTSSITDAPFVGYIVQNELLPTYSSLEQSEYPAEYASNVTNATLENLFDIFMGQVESGGLTGTIAKAGNEIGSCLAKKVEEGKAASCPLDVTDAPAVNKPNIFTQAMMKISCPLPFSFYSPCDVRQAIYAVAKSELITMRPQWPGLFNDAYPGTFRSTLMGGINTDRAAIGKIVATKFGGTYDDSFWSKAPLVDLDDTTGRTMTLHEFSRGMSNDLRASSLLAVSSNPEVEGLAGALFYAGANRLLVLMGGTESKWDGTRFLPVTGDAFDSKNPLKAPELQTETFGGLTAMASGMLPLDITNYSPMATTSPTPVQLFPSQFVMGEQGVPRLNGVPVETLQDVGDLMNSLIDFMTLSQPNAALSSHFASAASITDIVDPTKPALFPTEGRELAAGLIAALFQNILVNQGHLQQPPADGAPTPAPDPDHDGVFGLKFYDQVGLQGRLPGKVTIDSLSTLFMAAIRFDNLMNQKDPSIPAALMALQDQVNLVINLGLLSITSNGQCADGGFVTYLGDVTATPAPTNRELSVAVNALRTLTLGYSANPSGAVRQAIHAGWAYMDRFWSITTATGFPLAIEPQSGAVAGSQAAASAETLWAVMDLWKETQNTAIYADLMNSSLDPDWATTQGWDKWASRFGSLQKGL